LCSPSRSAWLSSFLLWLGIRLVSICQPERLGLLAALATHRVFAGKWRAFRLWSALPRMLRGIAYLGLAVLNSAFAAAFFMTRTGFASLILGAVWGHLPLTLAHVYNVTWWQFLAVTMAVSVILSFAFNTSGGSTITAVVVHGLYNVGPA